MIHRRAVPDTGGPRSDPAARTLDARLWNDLGTLLGDPTMTHTLHLVVTSLRAVKPPADVPSSGVRTPPTAPAAYMGPEDGPFRCDHCDYFTAPDACRHPAVIRELGGTTHARVSPAGCCNHYEPVEGPRGGSHA